MFCRISEFVDRPADRRGDGVFERACQRTDVASLRTATRTRIRGMSVWSYRGWRDGRRTSMQSRKLLPVFACTHVLSSDTHRHEQTLGRRPPADREATDLQGCSRERFSGGSGLKLAILETVEMTGHAAQVPDRGCQPAKGFWRLAIVVGPMLVIVLLEIGVSSVSPLWGR